MMPWKVLGRKWHLARKGFPPGKKPDWPLEVLEDLLEQLSEVTGELASVVGPPSPKPSCQFLWNNQQVVNLMVPEQRDPWAVIYTKRLGGVDLQLNGPPGAFATGRIAELASQRAINTDDETRDQIKLRFVTAEDLDNGDLADFLSEHLETLRGAAE